MTQTALDVLTAFEALAPADQHRVAAEILRRSPAGELSEAALHELADELFLSYDAEEAARADT